MEELPEAGRGDVIRHEGRRGRVVRVGGGGGSWYGALHHKKVLPIFRILSTDATYYLFLVCFHLNSIFGSRHAELGSYPSLSISHGWRRRFLFNFSSRSTHRLGWNYAAITL